MAYRGSTSPAGLWVATYAENTTMTPNNEVGDYRGGFARSVAVGEHKELIDSIAEKPLHQDDTRLDPYRYPDADEVGEYFDEAKQASEIEVEIKHTVEGEPSVEGLIVGETGYRWWLFVEREVAPVPIQQLIEVPQGIYISDSRGLQTKAECIGLFEDHGVVYERMVELLERILRASWSEEEAAGHAINKIQNHSTE